RHLVMLAVGRRDVGDLDLGVLCQPQVAGLFAVAVAAREAVPRCEGLRLGAGARAHRYEPRVLEAGQLRGDLVGDGTGRDDAPADGPARGLQRVPASTLAAGFGPRFSRLREPRRPG